MPVFIGETMKEKIKKLIEKLTEQELRALVVILQQGMRDEISDGFLADNNLLPIGEDELVGLFQLTNEEVGEVI